MTKAISDPAWMNRRFTDRVDEADYGEWRVITTVTIIRYGMIASVLSWSIYMCFVGLVLPEKFVESLMAVLVVAQVPILATLAMTYWQEHWSKLLPMTALANCSSGLLVAWQVHEQLAYNGAPATMSSINVLVMFFAFTIFRMPPAVSVLAVLPYLTLVTVLLLGDYQTGVISVQQFSGAIMAQLVAFVAGLMICIMLEVITRRAYTSETIIKQQRKAAEQTRELIRRYMPPAVAERIVSGEEAAIDLPQRRRITVMFSDIVGFTDMADRLDAESLTQILNEYMAAMAEIVEAHGGTLNEFAGDGLMALFGAPAEMPPENQVYSAAQAAKAMQQRLPELNEGWLKLGIDEPLRIRIGINTGVLSVGSFGSAGRMTYTAIGLQTNVAARIEAKCEPGEVLMSHSSWQLVKDRIKCELQGEVDIKGVHYPVKLYRISG